MDIVRLRITYDFLRPSIPLSWSDVPFGLDQELLDPKVPIQLAKEQIGDSVPSASTVLALAGLQAGEAARSYVERLAASEPQVSVEQLHEKWLCLVLAWLFEQRKSYQDPLQMVECVYADFGYPRGIAEFVRYMPSDEPDLAAWNERGATIREVEALRGRVFSRALS